MISELMFLLVIAAQTAPVAPSTWEQGKRALERKDFAAAKQFFASAAAESPADPAPWFFLGLSCGELNQLDEAIAALEKAHKLAPNRAEVDFNLGLLYWRRGDIGKAKEAYKDGFTLAPDDPGALQNYASLLMKKGETEKAIAPLLLLRDTQGLALQARVSLIDCYLKTNQRENAERELGDLLQSHLAGSEEQTKIAAILIEDGDLNAAESVLQSSLQIDPKQPKAYAALGLVSLNQKRYREAAISFESAVHLEPDSAEYAMAFANALVLWNRPNTLLAFLKSVENKFGNLPEFQHKLAFANYSLAEYSNAIGILENLLRANPPRQDQIYFLLGDSYMGMGEFNKSEIAFKKAIELNPKDPMYYESYAVLLRKEGRGRIDDAIDQLQNASQLGSPNPSLLLQLGLCYESKGNLDRAAALLENAVRGAPDSLSTHVALARVYFRLGRQEKGQEQKRTIAELETKLQREKLAQ